MTASENIEGLDDLVDAFPDIDFHIGAQTSMGPKLACLKDKKMSIFTKGFVREISRSTEELFHLF